MDKNLERKYFQKKVVAGGGPKLEAREFKTTSGIEVNPFYTEEDLPRMDPSKMGPPGAYPYTRGLYPDGYRKKEWTMRQYAGFGTAEESNKRYHFLLSQGQTGLSVAFSLTTQMGYDSDHPLALGEVGKSGVAIDSLKDMETLFNGIPLDKVSTSMTINATAAILLAYYLVVAEKQGVDWKRVSGTIQNDLLKEYIARGTYIYPPAASMRIITDIFAFCEKHVPKWNTISISGYHIREAGATAAQEIAFTLANGIAYVGAAIQAGLNVDQFAPRLSFFFNVHNNLFEEVAKFRGARQMWARIMKDRFQAKDPKSWMLRMHTQTAGSTLTAQQPENNVVRVAVQALAAVLGGTQSLHTNSRDEALGLPTQASAQIALRTQQIIFCETGVVQTADPLAGSYFVENLTEKLVEQAQKYLDKIEGMGGAVKAVEAGYQRGEIDEAAFAHQKAVDKGDQVIVGVNRFKVEETSSPDVLRIDPAVEKGQRARLAELKSERDSQAVTRALKAVEDAAKGTNNLMPVIIEAARVYATVGEISDALRRVFGQYQPH